MQLIIYSCSILAALILIVGRPIAGDDSDPVTVDPNAIPFSCPDPDQAQALCSNNTAPVDSSAYWAVVVKPYPQDGDSYLCPPVQDPFPNRCCRTDYKIKYLYPGQSLNVTIESFQNSCGPPTY
ncbi:hypothetical protein PCANC_21918 [Puccinia coronata f. sp. avenae]|uniref:Hydrophobin n=1 Tax=Puccinia coronata f. sp. avenae TaxID=200324 RepID=A0A2N5S3J6_9BASI|nr:hypothetical protein PCASD_24623 [Puccinia coronata f. sp. avenae]PLW28528.1 hypothetical protein PCANC_21918 [Puccinia coronata f. sp. avenae]PLW28981.1 hypothetical protein PCASD_19466 [Puccinia coronata f. sp. avenae]